MLWIWILIVVFIDIFRSHDLSGWAKALWFLFVLFIPLIGVLVYLIARGSSMQERAQQDARQQDQEFRSYVQQAASSSPASTADQLAKLADLKRTRDSAAVRRTLDRLGSAARGTDNLMPPILDAVRAYATVGEMCDALREVWGEYEETPMI